MTTDRATLTLLSAGVCTLVVDGGRPRTRGLGVPLGGAADRFALAIGNALVGNPPDAPALEVGLAGPTLVSDAPVACVLYGAPFAMSVDGHQQRAGRTFTLRPGQTLHVGGTPRGARAYFCVRGGVDAPLVLGSRSSLAPLAAGARLACRSGTIAGRFVVPALAGAAGRPPEGGTTNLRVLPGGQAGWFPEQAVGGGRTFRVTPASNRMGARLEGEPLPLPGREMTSEPVCPGTVQVTRDGQCIVLGVDGQTIGGYPKVAQVVSGDLDRLGQLRPGEEVRFEYVAPDEAEALAQRRQAERRAWLTRLRTAEILAS